jgi:hypothetical protein
MKKSFEQQCLKEIKETIINKFLNRIEYAVKHVYNGHPWDLKNVAVMQRAV